MQVSLYLLGLALQCLSALNILPLICNILKKSKGNLPFLICAIISYSVGWALYFFFKPEVITMKFKQVFFFTGTMWITIPLFAAIPLWLEINICYADAFFETVSAITTTGATVLCELSKQNPGILLWRSLLQWIGGIGFIAFTVAIFPFFNISSISLFQSEASGWATKLTSKFSDTVKKIITLYVALTLACVCCYFIAGMNLFQAINHAFTTVSTGGYSVFDDSIGHYNNYYIYWIAIIFMALSSMTFITLIKFMEQKQLNILADMQILFFVVFLLFFSVIVASYLVYNHNYNWLDALTQSTFNVTSVVTTTGYVTEDYSTWGSFVVCIFCLLLVAGGCSGSTAGGIKMFRIQIFFTMFLNHMKKTLHPNSVIIFNYNNKEIDSNIMCSLIGFVFAFFLCIFIMALLLCLDGMDLMSSFSGAATAVANVGPGFGKIIGPAGNFSSLSDFSKWVLSIGMLFGRLEITTLVIILVPYFWKK